MTIPACKRDECGFWYCECDRQHDANDSHCNRCNSGPGAMTREAELRAALLRLLEAFKADKEICPTMPVLISWQTNGGAIAQARLALSRVE